MTALYGNQQFSYLFTQHSRKTSFCAHRRISDILLCGTCSNALALDDFFKFPQKKTDVQFEFAGEKDHKLSFGWSFY